jgi:hypothetical protein
MYVEHSLFLWFYVKYLLWEKEVMRCYFYNIYYSTKKRKQVSVDKIINKKESEALRPRGIGFQK